MVIISAFSHFFPNWSPHFDIIQMTFIIRYWNLELMTQLFEIFIVSGDNIIKDFSLSNAITPFTESTCIFCLDQQWCPDKHNIKYCIYNMDSFCTSSLQKCSVAITAIDIYRHMQFSYFDLKIKIYWIIYIKKHIYLVTI